MKQEQSNLFIFETHKSIKIKVRVTKVKKPFRMGELRELKDDMADSGSCYVCVPGMLFSSLSSR